MSCEIFEITKDINRDSAWFIYNLITHHILNEGDINDDEYKKLFVQGGEDNFPKSIFISREDAEKVFQNLSKIYLFNGER